MIYIASPYSHSDKKVMEERFRQVCILTARLMREGYNCFSPIAHSHPIAQYNLPKTWEFWQKHDLEFLKKCDRLIVADTMDGWDKSRGVGAEINFARDNGIEVIYLSEFWEED